MDAEESPGEMSLYVALTKGHADRNLGNAIRQIQRTFGLDGRFTERNGQLIWLHHNGHMIWLAGCQHTNEAEKFRGDYYTKVVIDEGASFPSGVLDYLVDDVLRYALVDKQAPLAIAGTPGVLPIGFFFEVTTGAERREVWPTHSWSMLDNPFIPHAAQELAEIMRERGETIELFDDLISDKRGSEEEYSEFLSRLGVSPGLQREFFYQWVKDEDALVYNYNPEINRLWDDEFPRDCTRWLLVLDLGVRDDTAFTVCGVEGGKRSWNVLKSYGKPGMNTGQRAAECRRIEKWLGDYIGNPSYRFPLIVVDEGGLGLGISKDMQEVYGLPTEPAEKKGKAQAIRNLQADIKTGLVRFHAEHCQQLFGEMSVLPWNEKRDDHHSGYADHCCDSLLYAHRKLVQWEKWEIEPPELGTAAREDFDIAEHKKMMAEVSRIEQSNLPNRAKRNMLRSFRGSRRRY